MKAKKWVLGLVLSTVVGIAPEAHALSLDDLFKKKTACDTSLYPTFDQIVKRKALIAKDKSMLMYHCAAQSPAVALCPSFLEFVSLDNAKLQFKLATDTAFWANAVAIDRNFALSKSGKDEHEYKYAMFLGLYQQRNDVVDQTISSGRPVETVFIGDSLMHIFEAYGTAEFPKGLFVGVGGDRTDSLLYRIQYHVGKIRPKNVVLSISGNDFLQDCDNKKVQERRKLIVQVLKAQGVQNIYWLSLPPLGDQKLSQKIPAQNAQVMSLQGIQYVDTWTEMAGPDLMIKPEYKGDWIHFNERAYREVWIPKLKALGL